MTNVRIWGFVKDHWTVLIPIVFGVVSQSFEFYLLIMERKKDGSSQTAKRHRFCLYNKTWQIDRMTDRWNPFPHPPSSLFVVVDNNTVLMPLRLRRRRNWVLLEGTPLRGQKNQITQQQPHFPAWGLWWSIHSLIQSYSEIMIKQRTIRQTDGEMWRWRKHWITCFSSPVFFSLL